MRRWILVPALLMAAVGCLGRAHDADPTGLKIRSSKGADEQRLIQLHATAYCQARMDASGHDIFAVRRDFGGESSCNGACAAYGKVFDPPGVVEFAKHGLGDISCSVYADSATDELVNLGGHPDGYYDKTDPAQCDWCCCQWVRSLPR